MTTGGSHEKRHESALRWLGAIGITLAPLCILRHSGLMYSGTFETLTRSSSEQSRKEPTGDTKRAAVADPRCGVRDGGRARDRRFRDRTRARSDTWRHRPDHRDAGRDHASPAAGVRNGCTHRAEVRHGHGRHCRTGCGTVQRAGLSDPAAPSASGDTPWRCRFALALWRSRVLPIIVPLLFLLPPAASVSSPSSRGCPYVVLSLLVLLRCVWAAVQPSAGRPRGR